jgi:drug/metabolite transporter (DMT)-like permease
MPLLSPLAPADRTVGLGIAHMVTAVTLFCAAGALVKWSAATYPVIEVVFFRNIFALLPTALLIWMNGGLLLLRTPHPASHLYRGAAGLTSMILIFYALSVLPLADATALSFASPLFMTALSVPLLGERVGAYRWSAVLLGFLGILIITRPGHGVFTAGALAALGSALSYALAVISVRQMSRTEHPVTIAAYYALVCTVASGLALPFFWLAPGPVDFAILALIGVTSGFAQYFQTQAFRLAPVAVVGTFNYLGILFAGIFGFLVWHEVPSIHVLVGSAVVIACGLFILYRETRRRRPA